ncbi:MAG: ATP-binding protein [Chthoniobacterales bacterium]
MKSLRSQLTLRLLAGGMLLLGAAGAALYWQVSRALTLGFDDALLATAQSFASLTEQDERGVEVEFHGESMPDFELANGPAIFLLRQADGTEIERSHSFEKDIVLPSLAATAGKPSFFDFTPPDGRRLRCVLLRFTPGKDDGDSENAPGMDAELVIGKNRVPLDSTLASLRMNLLLVGATTLVMFIAIVRWSVRSGLGPLDQLARNVAEINASSLATRFSTDNLPAELQPIAARLNELLARLQSAFERERRFTAAAAHELRTPLAELRALAEVNLTTPATPAERADSWSDALATTRRMESLSLRLLELSRAESTDVASHRESVFVPGAFEKAWLPWADFAIRRGVSLDASLPADLFVMCDRVVLDVILGNLCANAAQHAPENTTFRVSAASTADAVTMSFRNAAGTLAVADIPHLFERFWRKDSARSDASHHGIGLSLAAEFASLVGGTLTARLATKGDLEFILQLPASAPVS